MKSGTSHRWTVFSNMICLYLDGFNSHIYIYIEMGETNLFKKLVILGIKTIFISEHKLQLVTNIS